MAHRLIPLFCSVLMIAPLHAADDNNTEMEEILVFGALSRFSALKSDVPLMETARSVSIITEEMIIDRGALALNDTFLYSSGVFGKTFGFSTRADSVRVRGLDVPQYQDSLQSLFGNYNNTRPDIYTLEQVEILKGPASALFGKGSPGGLVNVISKRPRDDASHEFVAEYGNFDRMQIGVDSTGPLTDDGKWLYRFIALYRDTETQIDFVEEETVVFAPSITWRPTDATDLTLLLNYTDTESDTGSQFLHLSGTNFPAPNSRSIDFDAYMGEPGFNTYEPETTSITLLASHQFSDVWSMELNSRYTDAENTYQQSWASFLLPRDFEIGLRAEDRWIYNEDNTTLYEDGLVPRTWFRSDRTSEQAAMDLRFRADFDTGALEHNMLMGAQYQDVTLGEAGYSYYALGLNLGTRMPDNRFGDQFWINPFDPQYGSIPDNDFLMAGYSELPDDEIEDIGIYLSDQISFDRWRLTLGIRWDQVENNSGGENQEDDEISSSIGVLYQFDNGLAPYASYSESFEPVVGDDGRAVNAQALDPREGEQIEVGIKYQPDDFPALVTLAYFELEESNLPDPESNPAIFEQQSGDAQIDGLELEAQAVLGDFSLDLALTWLDTENPDGARLDSVPEEQASFWTTWNPSGALAGFRAGAGIRYVGDRWDGNDRYRTDDYTVGDLMLGYAFKRWDLSVNVQNVTDEEYLATCPARVDCFVGTERTVVGRVRYRIE